ncbi:MAG TPA: efflux RND transporter permease subunit [Chthoniobacterales bacterium]|nr:efflux RND transporter permease subunit [Chthoniobacterales bacterium]
MRHDEDEQSDPAPWDGMSDGNRDAQTAPDQPRPGAATGAKTPAKLKQFSSGLSAPFIRRPVMTMLLTASIIVFGILAYKQLAVNDLPAVDYPVIDVNVSYPGANPETMANTIATPLEKQFTQIPGIALTTSSSTQGRTNITLTFNLDKTIDSAATDVQSAIQRATGQLPADLPSPPTFSKNNPNDSPVVFLALTSDTLTDGDLYKYATTQVAQRINILPGVSNVNIYGVKRAIRIKANPGALATRNLTLDELSAAIRSGTAYSGAGQFDGKNQTFILRPDGQIDTAEGYRNLAIARGANNEQIYLRDVAEVTESVQDERLSRHFFARGYAPPASIIVMAVSRQAEANAVQVARSVTELVPQLRVELPGSINLIPTNDRSQTIVRSVHDVQETLLIAFVLVVMIIFLFLGRATDTLIPVVALPLSLLITFTAMWALDFSINNLTLMALTLAIGFLVDDAIVFLENVVRRAESGESIQKATMNSAGEISFTILSMTLSLAAVFIPLVFMPGQLGRIFFEFAVTIIVAILASGIVSLTLTPLMCARLLGERGPNHPKTRTERFVTGFFDPVLRGYSRSLDWFLDRGWLAAPILLICALGLWFFFSVLPFTLLPTGDSGVIRGTFIMQEGSSPQQQRDVQDRIDPILQANPAVDKYFTVAGGGRGGGAGIFTVIFLKDGDRDSIDDVAGQLRRALSGIPGVMPRLSPQAALRIDIGGGGSSFGRYSYVLSGINPAEVYAAAEKLEEKLSTYDGFVAPARSDLFRNTPNVDIEIDRDRASLFGISTTDVQGLLRAAYSQNYVYLVKEADDQYQVILEVDDADRTGPEDLRQLYVKSDTTGAMVPMRSLTKARTSLGFQSVNHINQFTSVTFGFDPKPDVALGDVTAFIEKTAAEILPPTVKGELQGEGLVLQTLFGALPFLVLAALFVMYVILGILYESYLHPITVLSTLFPAVVGGLLTLWLFNSTLSLYSVIGLFLLMGIVKKNGIMIVDFALHRLDEGYDFRSAIHEASVERFRPIIMTTLAALMGAIPLALGYGADGASRRPLGLVIVGGLIVSQLITLYIIPVIYLWLEWFQENVLDRVPFLRSGHMHHEGDAGKPIAPEHPAPVGAA